MAALKSEHKISRTDIPTFRSTVSANSAEIRKANSYLKAMKIDPRTIIAERRHMLAKDMLGHLDLRNEQTRAQRKRIIFDVKNRKSFAESLMKKRSKTRI